MIKVALNGGLGNQLFQYATGKALALSNNTLLSLDLLSLASKLQWKSLATYRKYELDIFAIDAITNKPLFNNKYLYPLAKTHYFAAKFMNKLRFNYVKERAFEFDADLLHQPDNTYLEGHFQSERYFKHIEPVLRKELVFKSNLLGLNKDWASMISQTNSISLHIRRGDYLLNTNNLHKHGLTSVLYYKKTLEYISSKIEHPVFFIFTDDVKWVTESFNIDFPFYVVDNNRTPDTSYVDMQLMSLCKHNIICNSTFSWWGAWLNANSHKIVIAPKQWFADTAINSKDIYPSEWIKL